MKLFRKLFAEKILRFYEGTESGIRIIKNLPVIRNRIKEGMKMRKINAAQLAKMSGVSEASISNYLNDKVKPKTNNIQKLASALEVNEAWLMGYDVDPDADYDGVFKSDEIQNSKLESSENYGRLYKNIIRKILDDSLNDDDLKNIDDYVTFILTKK